MASDDERLARALRELRRRSGKTMVDVADSAGVTLLAYRALERGDAGSARVEVVRRVFAVFDARARMSVWWRGAELDRILDEAHAAVVEQLVGELGDYRWLAAPEVTFSEYGERGSVDVLGLHESTGCGLVTEVKASWGSIEETNRGLDVKTRLGTKLIEQRFGTRPTSVSRLLVFPEAMTHRRVAERHASTLAAVYPQRGRAIRAWLRRPSGSISGLWFLSNRADSASVERVGPVSRGGPTLK